MRRRLIVCILGLAVAGLVVQAQEPVQTANRLPRAGLLTLIVRDRILKELEMDQIDIDNAGIRDLAVAMEAELSDHLRQVAADDLEQRDEITFRVKAKYEAELKQKLTPEQFTRLQQIHWQLSGPEAMCEPDVAKSLEIDDEKVAKLKVWARSYYARLKASTDVGFVLRQERKAALASGSGVEELEKKQRKMLDEQKRNSVEIAKGLFEIVTPGQMADFNRMKGKLITNIVPSRLRHAAQAGDLMLLALRDPVLKELGIARDAPEVGQIRSLYAKVTSEGSKVLPIPGPLDIASPGQQAAMRSATFDPEMAKLLSPEQFTRLRQIYWQQLEGQALDDPDVVKQLQITTEQQTRIADLDFDLMRAGFDLTFAPIHERAYNIDVQHAIQDLAVELDRQKFEILTAVQKLKLTEIKGEPFDMALLQQPAQIRDLPKFRPRQKKN